MKAVLVTGARGYLGARIAALYARAGRRVIAWARDLRDDAPFAGIDPADVGAIVHAAAVTRFNVAADLAHEVNLLGTVKVLRFAERCRGLEALGLLSTLYASGLAAGAIEERAFDGARGFANHYERSKWQAEAELLGRFAHLPWRVFRIATVIADDDSGEASRHNVVHNTLGLLYHGLLSLLPGKPGTPLYFVTRAFAAGSVYELMQRRVERVIYHVSPHRAHAVTLDELLAIAWDVFSAAPQFARRRLLPPQYAGAAEFGHLAGALGGFGSPVLAQAMASMTPFAPQLYVDKSVDNRNLRAAMGGWEMADARALVRRTCERLVASKWGHA